MDRYSGLLGIAVFVLIGVALSNDRRRIRWRLVGAGLLLQFVVAAACLGDFLPGGGLVGVIDAIARGFTRVISFADAGTGCHDCPRTTFITEEARVRLTNSKYGA